MSLTLSFILLFSNLLASSISSAQPLSTLVKSPPPPPTTALPNSTIVTSSCLTDPPSLSTAEEEVDSTPSQSSKRSKGRGSKRTTAIAKVTKKQVGGSKESRRDEKRALDVFEFDADKDSSLELSPSKRLGTEKTGVSTGKKEATGTGKKKQKAVSKPSMSKKQGRVLEGLDQISSSKDKQQKVIDTDSASSSRKRPDPQSSESDSLLSEDSSSSSSKAHKTVCKKTTKHSVQPAAKRPKVTSSIQQKKKDDPEVSVNRTIEDEFSSSWSSLDEDENNKVEVGKKGSDHVDKPQVKSSVEKPSTTNDRTIVTDSDTVITKPAGDTVTMRGNGHAPHAQPPTHFDITSDEETSSDSEVESIINQPRLEKPKDNLKGSDEPVTANITNGNGNEDCEMNESESEMDTSEDEEDHENGKNRLKGVAVRRKIKVSSDSESSEEQEEKEERLEPDQAVRTKESGTISKEAPTMIKVGNIPSEENVDGSDNTQELFPNEGTQYHVINTCID